MLKKWRPWNFILRRAARRYGFIDPVSLLARLRQFGRPSEVQEPIELLRAGVIFHARGLINTRAIQYNLDWVWPYWAVKQFTPRDASFIPRGFAFSHVNLTHRNWTAVGHPNLDLYPIIDPRGLVTPLFDGWSVDFWVLSDDGERLFPSRLEAAEQTLDLSPVMSVITSSKKDGLALETAASAVFSNGRPELILKAEGEAAGGGQLIASIRPYNPEGVRFIDHIGFDPDAGRLRVNGEDDLYFEDAPEKTLFSGYEKGDVALHLDRNETERAVSCPIGMATAAAFFPIAPGKRREIEVRVPLTQDPAAAPASKTYRSGDSASCLFQTAELRIPDPKLQFLYDAAVRTMLLLTAGEVFPGPYTYRRFWFRDACFMINALLGLGLSDRSRRLILTFPARQTLTGYFQSQEGEWDSNGQVLWLAERFHRLTGASFDKDFLKSLMKGAEWIRRKRRQKGDGKRHDGLLPAGFSAEHLGPNDYYYWDNFWALAGLNAAARLSREFGDNRLKQGLDQTIREYRNRIFASVPDAPGRAGDGAIPASPYRRMDAGAVGSLVADYPLQITPPGDPMIMKTVSYLTEHCFYGDGFFQDMIHSGINIYLTLDIAQTFLRCGDERYRRLIAAAADLASPTGQWPEAVNPLTGGGCMGDGQHGWAAAEWIMMMRSLFIREEGDRLVIGSGIFPEWLDQEGAVSFGPTLVPGGALKTTFDPSGGDPTLHLEAEMRGAPVPCTVAVPGYAKKEIDTACKTCKLERL